MRKIIFLIHVTLDGLIAGPSGEMDWIVYNDEVAQYSYDLHETTDTAIYGRVTYEMMAAYWSTVLDDPNSDEGERKHARWLEGATKIAVSTTLESVDWGNSLLIRDNIAEQFIKLKQAQGKDMWLLGSPTLARSMMELNLIDEYRINVNPVILGSGKPLYGELKHRMNLKFIDAKTFEGGVIGLRYEPHQNEQ